MEDLDQHVLVDAFSFFLPAIPSMGRTKTKKTSTTEWEVKKIVSRRRSPDGLIQYRVRWKGTDKQGKSYDDSWEPAENCENCRDLIAEWRERKKRKVAQKKMDGINRE